MSGTVTNGISENIYAQKQLYRFENFQLGLCATENQLKMLMHTGKIGENHQRSNVDDHLKQEIKCFIPFGDQEDYCSQYQAHLFQ